MALPVGPKSGGAGEGAAGVAAGEPGVAAGEPGAEPKGPQAGAQSADVKATELKGRRPLGRRSGRAAAIFFPAPRALAAAPNAARRGSAAPNAARRGSAAPNAAQRAAAPNAARRGSVALDAARRGSAAPDVARPGSAAPNAARRGSAAPNAVRFGRFGTHTALALFSTLADSHASRPTVRRGRRRIQMRFPALTSACFLFHSRPRRTPLWEAPKTLLCECASQACSAARRREKSGGAGRATPRYALHPLRRGAPPACGPTGQSHSPAAPPALQAEPQPALVFGAAAAAAAALRP